MREWIVTNGLGSYASLTYNNENTRKFHGLLVASLDPPAKRWMFISNVYEKIQIGKKTYDLRNLRGQFTYQYLPTFHYDVDGVHIKKTVFMENGKNTTVMKYEITTDTPVSFFYHPVVNSRHFYDVTSQRHLKIQEDVLPNGIQLKPNNVQNTIKIFLEDAQYEPSFYWEEMYYQKDHERRDSWIDNNIHLGDFHKIIKTSSDYYLVCTLEDTLDHPAAHLYEQELQRKKNLLDHVNLPKQFEKLVLSTDNFIVKKKGRKSIVAGYHWFSDWGRDTLIALPGICLVTKRFADAKQILLSFGEHTKHGLIPNTFMDRDSQPLYNTVDAALWYVDRAYQYLKYTNDQEFLKEIWDVLQSIINGYMKGTDYGIHMDHDYLISHDEGLTWMDVKLGDYYPTPRSKKAVEIQALWYNALEIMSACTAVLGEEDVYGELANHVKKNFTRQYTHRYDVIDTKDLACRPNQIFLVSLDFSMIPQSVQENIVTDVQEHLLTPFGLRTLSPEDSRYKGTYIGDYNKDLAYHNGTVWPWLIGPFIRAFIKVKNREPQWRKYAYQNFLYPMLNVFGDTWDGSIYEIFDGDPPFLPQGCITQAWSVSELLRSWVEDIEGITPEYEQLLLAT
ncbi:MAG: amylo-alpha-1,6-glucosidase [Methanobacteriota archaeon]